ncbi:hypothetical protein ABIC89_006030 [Variovorax boronicumulans]|uniref:O-antigen ligase family protein n=1 Tax=Variovorax boronicumulans TaxID=436515 RepID=UPI0033910D6F
MRIVSKDGLSAIFLLSVLFVTTKSFYVFYGAAAFFLLILIAGGVSDFRIRVDVASGVAFVFLSSVFLIRTLYFSNPEDLKELAKIFLFFLIVWIGFFVKRKRIEALFSIFVVLNFLLALSQFLGFYEFGLQAVSDHYNAEKHIEASLSYSVPRALGFSSGPGQQSVIGLFFFSYFLTLYFWSGGGTRRVIFASVSLAIVLLSQSKTALLSFLAGSVFLGMLIFGRANSRGKYAVAILGGVLAVVLIFGSEAIVNFFPEYARLMEFGFGVSSLNDRYVNWEEMVDSFSKEGSVFFYIFGVGRSGLEAYGAGDLPFDSDYVYVFVNFGILGVVLFVLTMIFFLISGLSGFKRIGIYGKIIVVSLFYAIPAAISLNYFIEPRLFFIYAILISCCIREVEGKEMA